MSQMDYSNQSIKIFGYSLRIVFCTLFIRVYSHAPVYFFMTDFGNISGSLPS